MSFRTFIFRFFLSIIFFTTSSANANSIFDGFYLGASVGGSLARAKENINASLNFTLLNPDGSPALTSTQPAAISTEMTQSSWLGQLLGGYGYAWGGFYLGGEVFVNAANYQMKNSVQANLSQNLFNIILLNANVNAVSKTEVSPIQYGLHLRPGYLITPTTLLFALIGTSFAQVTSKVSASATASVTNNLIQNLAPPIFTFPTAINVSKRERRAALQLGGGMEQRIYDRWSIRADYIYTYYGTVTMSANQTLAFGSGSINLSANHQVKVSDNAVTLGLMYYLG